MSLKALGQACCACAEQRSLPLLTRAAVTGRLASAGRLLTWQPAVGPAFCLFEAKMHHQHVRQRTRIQEGNGKHVCRPGISQHEAPSTHHHARTQTAEAEVGEGHRL